MKPSFQNESMGNQRTVQDGNVLSDAEQQMIKDIEHEQLKEASKLYDIDQRQQLLKQKQEEEGIHF
mgnify:FL=1